MLKERLCVTSFALSPETIVVFVQVGKEFSDTRQIERRIKFIRVGDTVKTAGWLKGEATPFAG